MRMNDADRQLKKTGYLGHKCSVSCVTVERAPTSFMHTCSMLRKRSVCCDTANTDECHMWGDERTTMHLVSKRGLCIDYCSG